MMNGIHFFLIPILISNLQPEMNICTREQKDTKDNTIAFHPTNITNTYRFNLKVNYERFVDQNYISGT
jgi:hypothetical protein